MSAACGLAIVDHDQLRHTAISACAARGYIKVKLKRFSGHRSLCVAWACPSSTIVRLPSAKPASRSAVAWPMGSRISLGSDGDNIFGTCSGACATITALPRPKSGYRMRLIAASVASGPIGWGPTPGAVSPSGSTVTADSAISPARAAWLRDRGDRTDGAGDAVDGRRCWVAHRRIRLSVSMTLSPRGALGRFRRGG